MTLAFLPPGRAAAAWAVLTLFVIPIGGGIAPGVLLAKARHLSWYETAFLYFVSDLLLAVVFEPFLHLAAALARRHDRVARAAAAVKASLRRTASLYGKSGGPFTLLLVAFGVDPMSGRTAARLAGHGFVSGWSIAIAGDMLYYAVIAACTLSLRSILGDGTGATLLILVVMIVVPLLLQRRAQKRLAP